MTNPSSTPPDISRRQVLKTYVQLGAFFSLCAPVRRLLVGEVHAQAAGLEGRFRIDLAVAPFTALQSLNGSVRVEVPNGAGSTPLIALAGNATPSVIITRVALSGPDQFGALGQRCTHQGFAVNARSSAGPNLVCSSGHGSTFDPGTGTVATGPATLPLFRYTASFTANPSPGILTITIPGIGYSTAGTVVGTARGQRLRFVFPSRSGTIYQVRFRSAIGQTDAATGFFTTPDGTNPVQSIAGTGATLTVYVPPTPEVGFYQIAALP